MRKDAPSVLISFRKSQQAVADELEELFSKRGFHPWKEGFTAGEFWRTELLERLKTSDCVVLVLSSDYVESEFCRMEAFIARSYGRFVIPVVVDNCWQLLRQYEETRGLSEVFAVMLHSDNIVGLPADRKSMLERVVQGIESFKAGEDSAPVVYVSYSGSSDGAFATEVADGLAKAGVNPWVATRNVRVGENWRAAQAKAMMRATQHIVVLDENIVNSQVLRTEILMAEACGIDVFTIFPPRLDRDDEPARLMVKALNEGDQTFRRLTERQFYRHDQLKDLVKRLSKQ